MNPEQWLATIANLIDKKPISGSGTWILVWRNNQVQLVSSCTARPLEIRFGQITAFDARYGLTSRHWNQIKASLTTFLIQKGLL